MAQFYGEIQGNRGEATRMGTKSSGLRGHIRGWEVGVSVECSHEDGKDVIKVWRTSGSNGSQESKLMAILTETATTVWGVWE